MQEMKTGYGYTDDPIKLIKDDELKITDYVESLSQFVVECDTPMTISIQGEWGSGKTSMMNMIKQKLDGGESNSVEKNDNNVLVVWFNTWQYSQFEMTPYLATSLLMNFFQEIDANNGRLREMARKIGIFITFSAQKAAIYGTEKIIGQLAGQDLKAFFSGTGLQKDIKEFKDEIIKSLRKKLDEGKKKKVVIFIDDLDRLEPKRAVEFLEVVKVFLDIPQCVFIIAVDYDVVVRGLRAKFDKDFSEQKARKFFEKIIQLPFSMPVGNYKINEYVKNLLADMKIETGNDPEHEEEYISLIRSSVNFNPRGIKRLFNNFLLLNAVAQRRKIVVADSGTARNHQLLMLFGVICMQLAYKEVYDYLLDNSDKITKELLDNLSDKDRLLEDGELKEQILGKITDPTDKKNYARRIARFMSDLCGSMQTENEESDERENFKNILFVSSVTSVSDKPSVAFDEKLSREDLAKYLVEALTELDDAASRSRVIERMKMVMKKKNIELESEKKLQNEVDKAQRYALKKNLLLSSSPHGTWELSARGKKMGEKFKNRESTSEVKVS
jgi:hypothetical protein